MCSRNIVDSGLKITGKKNKLANNAIAIIPTPGAEFGGSKVSKVSIRLIIKATKRINARIRAIMGPKESLPKEIPNEKVSTFLLKTAFVIADEAKVPETYPKMPNIAARKLTISFEMVR